MQNRRNVQVGSLENQPKPRTGKDGFLCHVRLGLVGWISYWGLGDSALAVIVLVALIQTLGLTELVSDDLGNCKQKEAETNGKIVDLFKDSKIVDLFKDLVSIRSGSRRYGSKLVALGMGKVRGMASEPW